MGDPVRVDVTLTCESASSAFSSWLPSFWRLGPSEQPSVWLRPHKGERIPHLRRRLGRGRPQFSEFAATLPYCCHCTTHCASVSYGTCGSIAAKIAKYLIFHEPQALYTVYSTAGLYTLRCSLTCTPFLSPAHHRQAQQPTCSDCRVPG